MRSLDITVRVPIRVWIGPVRLLDPTGVRDSKEPTGPALVFTPPAWRAFLADLPSRRR
jgi:hypothetical protein